MFRLILFVSFRFFFPVKIPFPYELLLLPDFRGIGVVRECWEQNFLDISVGLPYLAHYGLTIVRRCVTGGELSLIETLISYFSPLPFSYPLAPDRLPF